MGKIKKSSGSDHQRKGKISYAERDLNWIIASDHLQNPIAETNFVPAERLMPLNIPFFWETSKKHWKIKR